jgi:hypothetical protein
VHRQLTGPTLRKIERILTPQSTVVQMTIFDALSALEAADGSRSGSG